jgi:hypothetical protein
VLLGTCHNLNLNLRLRCSVLEKDRKSCGQSLSPTEMWVNYIFLFCHQFGIYASRVLVPKFFF